MATHVSAVEFRGTREAHARFWRGVWRVADPKITLASAASMILGLGLAAAEGPVNWGWLAVTVLGVFLVEAAKNASGELFDWDSGADRNLRPEDRSPFSGGKRVLLDGLWTRWQTLAVGLGFFTLGGLAGLAIVFLREPRVFWLGVAGFALAFWYHAPPFRLSYRGLGEAAVATAYGPVIVAGTYLVQRHELPLKVFLAALPLGVMIAAFLWINEFPDRRADEAAGKRTWVVRLGPRRAAVAFSALVGIAFVALALLPLFGVPWPVLVGFVGLPHAVRAARRLRADPDNTPWIIPAQAWTLASFLLLSIGSAVGLAAGRVLEAW